MKKLEGKIAVITGGNSGIGLATAQRFVSDGAYVFITGRRQSELDEAVKQIGTNVSGIQGNVSNLADLDRLYAAVKKQKGRIDILFANAGVGELAPLGAITEAHFDKMFSINVKGLLFTAKGTCAISGRRRRCGLDHFECFDCFIQRDRGVKCLQRNQGSHTVVCSHLDSRAETPQDLSQCHQSWSYRHTGHQWPSAE